LLNPEVFFFKVVLASVVFCVSMWILETLSMSIKKTSQDFDWDSIKFVNELNIFKASQYCLRS
jgi:hypothetical protein